MFNYDTVCSEIEDLVQGSVTQNTTSVLADLLYIKRHLWEVEDAPRLTREEVMEWVRRMQNADGTTGPHWTMEKTEEIRKQKGISCASLDFYAAMNMMYSDYAAAVEKAGGNCAEVCACMAQAFLEDKDAKPGKLARYYYSIVKK